MRLKETILVAFIIAVFITSSYAVFGAQSLVGYCNDLAQLEILRYGSNYGPVYAKQKGQDWFDVPGTWTKEGKMMRFLSEDMQLLDRAVYEIEITASDGSSLGRKDDIVCPGFRFSCAILELDIEECKLKGDEYYVKFKAKNIAGYDDLNYYAETENMKLYEKTPVSSSGGFTDFFVTEFSPDNYVLGFKTKNQKADPVKYFSISHEYCKQKQDLYYTYETIQCDVNRCSSDLDCKSDESCDSRDGICKELDCNFCTFKNKCFEYGNVIPIGEDIWATPYYCANNGLWVSQKQNGLPCAASFECFSNVCENSYCVAPVIEAEINKTVNDTLIVPVVEEPKGFASLFYILKIVGIFLAFVSIIVLAFRHPLPAIGTYALRLEKQRKETILRKINNFLDRHIMEDRARMRS